MRSLTYALVGILTVCMIGATITSHTYAEILDEDKIRENTPMQDNGKTNEWKAMKKYNCDKMYKHGENDKYDVLIIIIAGIVITQIILMPLAVYIILTDRKKKDLKDGSDGEDKDDSSKGDSEKEEYIDKGDVEDDSEKDSIDEDNIEGRDEKSEK